MRGPYYIFVAVCILLLFTVKPSLQDRLPPTKSTTVNQKYVLFKPISAALSYIYLTKQTLSSSATPYITSNNFSSRTQTDYDTISFARQQETFDDSTKHVLINKSSSNAMDTNHRNGPVTALALVLFFCVLSF